MQDVLVVVFQIIADNFFLLYSLFLNFIFIIVIFKLAQLYGPFFTDSIKVSFGLMKDPNLFAIFGASRRFILEWRPYSTIQNVRKNDKASDIILIDRSQITQVGTLQHVSERGFLGLFKKKTNIVRADTVYDDTGTTVRFDNNKEYRSFGMPAHIIVEGSNKTINPYDSIHKNQEARLSSHAVIQAIEGWKAYYSNKLEHDSVGKILFLVTIGLLAMFVIINILITLNTSGQLEVFALYFNENKEVLDSLLGQANQNLPRIEPG